MPSLNLAANRKVPGSKEPEVISAMVQALKDNDKNICQLAGDTIKTIGAAAVPALVEALKK